jgi:CheY-like chemotaxis protein
MDLQRLRTGRFEMRPRVNRLRATLVRTVDILLPMARVPVALWVHPGTPEHAFFDPLRLQQCVNNALSNACKYATNEGADIEVTVWTLGSLAAGMRPPQAPVSAGAVSNGAVVTERESSHAVPAAAREADGGTRAHRSVPADASAPSDSGVATVIAAPKRKCSPMDVAALAAIPGHAWYQGHRPDVVTMARAAHSHAREAPDTRPDAAGADSAISTSTSSRLKGLPVVSRRARRRSSGPPAAAVARVRSSGSGGDAPFPPSLFADDGFCLEWLVIDISDSGAGLGGRTGQALFEPFVQGAEAVSVPDSQPAALQEAPSRFPQHTSPAPRHVARSLSRSLRICLRGSRQLHPETGAAAADPTAPGMSRGRATASQSTSSPQHRGSLPLHQTESRCAPAQVNLANGQAGAAGPADAVKPPATALSLLSQHDRYGRLLSRGGSGATATPSGSASSSACTAAMPPDASARLATSQARFGGVRRTSVGEVEMTSVAGAGGRGPSVELEAAVTRADTSVAASLPPNDTSVAVSVPHNAPSDSALPVPDADTLLHIPAGYQLPEGDVSGSAARTSERRHAPRAPGETPSGGMGASTPAPPSAGASAARKGSGLGLALTASLVERMGGHVALAEVAGRTHFIILVPCPMKHAQPGDATPVSLVEIAATTASSFGNSLPVDLRRRWAPATLADAAMTRAVPPSNGGAILPRQTAAAAAARRMPPPISPLSDAAALKLHAPTAVTSPPHRAHAVPASPHDNRTSILDAMLLVTEGGGADVPPHCDRPLQVPSAEGLSSPPPARAPSSRIRQTLVAPAPRLSLPPGPMSVSSLSGAGGVLGLLKAVKVAAGAALAPPEQPTAHFLVCEDDLTNRRLVQRMLERIGCSCTLLEDGDMAAAALEASGQLTGTSLAFKAGIASSAATPLSEPVSPPPPRPLNPWEAAVNVLPAIASTAGSADARAGTSSTSSPATDANSTAAKPQEAGQRPRPYDAVLMVRGHIM